MQGCLGTGAGSTRLNVLQRTAGNQLGEEGVQSGAKPAYTLLPRDNFVQAQHGNVLHQLTAKTLSRTFRMERIQGTL